MTNYNHTKSQQWQVFSKIVKDYYTNNSPEKYEVEGYSIQDHLNHYVSNIRKDDSEIPICIALFAWSLYQSIAEYNVSLDQFLDHVNMHIKTYVETQYGNFPDKTIAKFTCEKIQGKLEAYTDRMGRSARGQDDEIRDSLKIAHFGCYLYCLIMHNDAQVMP